jgi:ABC-type transport system involved in multi-copper enzyme maturation permease subunit
MSKLWLVAQFQLKEMLRRRWILGVALLSLAILIGSGLVIARLADAVPPGGKTTQVAFTAGVVILTSLELLVTMVAIFGTAGVLPTELESGSFYALLPRPISRVQVYLGKLLGTLIVLWGLSLTMTGGLALSFGLILKAYPPGFGWVVLLYPLGPTVLAILTFALSTRMRAMGAGFLTIFLSFVGSSLPSLQPLAIDFGKSWAKVLVAVAQVLLPIASLPNWQSQWRDAAIRAGLDLTAVGGSAAEGAAKVLISDQILVPWAVAWLFLVLALGAFSFQRRNL